MKEALSHMLFIGVVLFAASYLKKDNSSSTAALATQVQTHIDRDLQRSADSTPVLALVQDTVKLPRRK